jgi:TRAP-type C4-dicarboxylate transport system substrate-binding protein
MLTGAAVAALMSTGAQAASWDMPTPYGDATFHTQNIRQFAEDVKTATGGDLTITVHSAGALFKHPDIKDAVRKGLAPAGEVLISRLANENPVYGIDSIPFLATGYDDAMRLWEASRPAIEEALAKDGLILLFAVPWPPQGLYAKQEIATIDDMQGLKFRAYNAATERLAQLAGAVPTQVEAPDIPTAFSTGRVDAMITSPSTGANSKVWDFLSHYHDTRAWLPKNMVIVNQSAFDELPADQQKALKNAASEAEQRGWEMSRNETKEKTQVLADNGITVVDPSDELMNALRDIGKTMTDEWLEEAGDAGKQVIDAYRP